MKYMTPELLARSKSHDDDEAEAALAEWEAASEAYRDHLKKIRDRLKPAVRKILRHLNLHDAKVLAIAVDERPAFSVLLELDTPARHGKYLELEYGLIGPLQGGVAPIHHPALKKHGKPFSRWLYDEFDIVQLETPNGEKAAVFEHSILFSGGVELRLLFSSFRYRRIRKLLLPPLPTATEAEGGLELLPA